MTSNGANPRTDRLEDRASRARTGGSLRLDERVASLRDRLEARADERTAGELRADVRDARAHVRDWSPDRAVNADTASRYARTVQQMRETGERPEDAGCKATYEFRRAALVHETRRDMRGALRDLDRAKRGGDVDGAARAYNRVRSGLQTLRQYPPTTGDRESDRRRQSAFRGPSRPERSNGKRPSLDNLPGDWRDDVQRVANDYDRAPLAVMALTGCRPAEVRGIRVAQDDGSIRFEIRGAKVDADRGVKTRTVDIDKSELEQSQPGRDLAAWLGNRDVRTVTHRGTVEAFRERVARAADRAGYDNVTAYTYRHAEARELKNSGADKEEIANRLGHRSERSQSVYG